MDINPPDPNDSKSTSEAETSTQVTSDTNQESNLTTSIQEIKLTSDSSTSTQITKPIPESTTLIQETKSASEPTTSSQKGNITTSNRQSERKDLIEMTREMMVIAKRSITRNIKPVRIMDVKRLFECVFHLWTKLKKFRMFLHGNPETPCKHALFDARGAEKQQAIYLNLIGKPMYRTDLSISEFMICGYFNSSHTLSDAYYKDTQLNKIPGFTIPRNLVCTAEHECIRISKLKTHMAYSIVMKVDGIDKVDGKSLVCNYGDVTMCDEYLYSNIDGKKAQIVHDILNTRRAAMKVYEDYLRTLSTGQRLRKINASYSMTSVYKYICVPTGTMFMDIDKFIQLMVKYIYIHCPNECESYRNRTTNELDYDKDDPMIQEWIHMYSGYKTIEDIPKNSLGLIERCDRDLPIATFLLGFMVDLLAIRSPLTFA